MTDAFSATRGRGAGPRLADSRLHALRRDTGRPVLPDGAIDERKRSARLASIVKFIGQLAQLPTEDEVLLGLIQAAAVWYDLDARAYRRDARDRFVLRHALPGADLTDGPSELVDCPPQAIRVSSVGDLSRLGWKNPLDDVLLLPVNVGPQPEWLLAVIGAADREIEGELGSLCAVVGTLLDRLTARHADEIHTRLARVVARRRGPLPEVSQAILAEIATSVSAAQACLWMALDDDRIISLATIGAPMIPPLRLREAQASASAERILIPVPGRGAGVGALDLRSVPDRPFTPEHARLAASGASGLGIWLAGLEAGGLKTTDPSPSIDVESRLREEIERARRFGLTIGLLIFNLSGTPRQPQLQQVGETLLTELRGQLRACDYIGSLDQGDLAVIFAQTDSRGLGAALNRIMQRLDAIARRTHLPAIRVGKAVYPAHAESATDLLMQARLAAQSPAGSIM